MVVLDPFWRERAFRKPGNYNPLWEVDPENNEAIDEAGSIADALIVQGGRSDPHWAQAARAVIRAIILLVTRT